MVRGLMDHYYSGVSRYTTSGFLRMKLGESLERRGVAPHIFESAEEAQSDLRDTNWP
jgi:propionate CoA-transferase